jgi:hypothetical protein
LIGRCSKSWIVRLSDHTPPRFEDFDPVLLPRLQFAFTVTFHIIFQSFTIGLSAFIATLLVHWIVTGGEHLRRLARFWTKIFAISFAMGVVSGIVLSYQSRNGSRREQAHLRAVNHRHDG